MLSGGLQPGARGMTAGQKPVEDDTEGVDIRRGGDGFAGHLLGCGILGSKREPAFTRERRQLLRARPFQELGDPEVQQLHLAGARHQHVGRFDVAVHDEVCVRVRHRGEELQEKGKPGLRREALFVAEMIQPGAVDVLQHQVGMSRVGNAGVDEAPDIGMGEAAQRAALTAEPLGTGPVRQRVAQQLDGDFGVVAPVVPAAEPHAAHSPLAERAHEHVGADAGACGWCRSQQDCARAAGEEPARLEFRLAAQQGLERRGLGGPVAPERGEPLRPFRVRQVERLVEQRAQHRERIEIRRVHAGAASSRR